MGEEQNGMVPNLPWLVFSWLWVGVPLAWGVWETIVRSLSLFR